jgi:predicted phage gp36 major capsid-like protein
MLAKEKMANEQREESEAELKEHMEKFEDIKKKLEQKEDELNAKNINFEKDQALVKQQLKFAEKQLEESKV